MEKLRRTPSQTVGPFFAYGLTAAQFGYNYNSIIDGSLVKDHAEGERIYVVGTVFDGGNNPVSDAMIELWQADTEGIYRTINAECEDGFTGFGRLGTEAGAICGFRFRTIKPGSIGKNNSPHINIILFMRGSLHQFYTRLYFSDEVEANKKDELLNQVPEERRHTLIARQIKKQGITEYHFDIHMQGKEETVFFEI
jgi:protocatechuate 3,4-dioxygenase, alpha subunit